MRTLSTDEIAGRAFELFQKRGGEPGHDLEDWFQAERELRRISAPEADDQTPGSRSDRKRR
jgi:hypothetical protein